METEGGGLKVGIVQTRRPAILHSYGIIETTGRHVRRIKKTKNTKQDIEG